jgi:hypothetical protein
MISHRRHGALEALEPRICLSVYYVSPSGSDTNPGTSELPWRTLQRASNTAGGGDTVIARAGNYAGFNIANSGTSAARLTFRGESGAVIDQPVTIGNRYGINGSGREYVTIEGFTFAPQASQGEWYAGVRLGGTPGDWVNGNIIRNNTFTMRVVDQAATTDRYGIYSSWNDGLLVEGNTVSGGYNSGIYAANSARNYTIRGNEVFDVGGNGIHNNGDASAGSPGLNLNATIEDNVIHNVGFGIGGQAISADGLQDSRIQNNLLYDIHAKGISLYVVDAADGSSDNVLVNNTIVVSSDGGAPLRLNHDSSNNTILNNIFQATTPSRAWVDAEESALVGSTIDYNVTTGVEFVGGTLRNDWESTYGFDTHSIIVTNPATLFVDVPSDDYHLRSDSPALDEGTTSNAPPIDFEGDPRPGGAGFDIGADERVTSVPPSVVSSQFDYLDVQQIVIRFSENVSASLATGDLVLRNLTTSTTVPSSNLALSYDTATNTATFTFPGFNGILPDADYRATLPANSVTDPDGNPLPADHVLDFFFLQGDINHDAQVNLADFNILAANFGQSDRNFGEGDLNYDGTVNLSDFNLLAGQFGRAI